jgi:hypothetical protein
VILRSLEKNPDHRYLSMAELLADLDTIAAGGTVNVGGRAGVAPPGNLAGAFQPARAAHAAVVATEPKSGGGGLVLVALAIVALLVVGGGVGAAVFFLAGDDEGLALAQEPRAGAPSEDRPAPSTDPTPAPNPHVPTSQVPPSQVSPTVVAQPAALAQPPQQAAVPEVPRVSITSEPPGAEVLLDGVMVGNTPAALPRPESGSQTITLRLRGHEEMQVQISPQTGEVLNVTLERERQAVVRAPRRPPVVTPTSTVAPPPPPIVRTPPRTGEVVDPWAN